MDKILLNNKNYLQYSKLKKSGVDNLKLGGWGFFEGPKNPPNWGSNPPLVSSLLHTHNSVYSAVNQLNQAWKWSETDSILHCLPLHHVHGFVNALLCPLSTGADIHMLGGFRGPEEVLSKFKGDINVFMAVPTIYTRIVKHLEENSLKLDLSGFRLLVSGSAALPAPMFAKFEKLGEYRLLERYGMTEINMALSNPLEPESCRIPGFVGKELPGVTVRLVDDDENVLYETGQPIEDSGSNISGKLYIKSPSMFKEYLNKQEATSETFTKDHWFKTGDMAEFNLKHQSFKILGRESTDIIKSGGYKISALEIEEKILEKNDDRFVEIAVIGSDCEDLGERIVAVVVVDESLVNCVVELDFGNLVKYQRPHVVHVMVEGLPRNVMGKVNKKQLKMDLKF